MAESHLEQRPVTWLGLLCMFEAVWAWCDVWFGRTPGWPEVVGLVVLLLCLVLSVTSLSFQGMVRAVTRGPRSSRRVAVTFDDGPDPLYTPQVLEVLERHGVKATFFLLGEKVDEHPELVRRLEQAGHEVGNHGYSHRWSYFLSPSRAVAAVGRTSDAIATVTGQAPRLFRPVYGLALPGVPSAARKGAMAVVGWTLRTRDGTGAGKPEERVRWTLERVRPGSIILLHDGPSFPEDPAPLGPLMLDGLLKGLRDKGFEPVTVPELLGWAK